MPPFSRQVPPGAGAGPPQVLLERARRDRALRPDEVGPSARALARLAATAMPAAASGRPAGVANTAVEPGEAARIDALAADLAAAAEDLFAFGRPSAADRQALAVALTRLRARGAAGAHGAGTLTAAVAAGDAAWLARLPPPPLTPEQAALVGTIAAHGEPRVRAVARAALRAGAAAPGLGVGRWPARGGPRGALLPPARSAGAARAMAGPHAPAPGGELPPLPSPPSPPQVLLTGPSDATVPVPVPAIKEGGNGLTPRQHAAMVAFLVAHGAAPAFVDAFVAATRVDPQTGKAKLSFSALVTPESTLLYTNALASGGFGRFHHALDLHSGAEVALKVLRLAPAAAPLSAAVPDAAAPAAAQAPAGRRSRGARRRKTALTEPAMMAAELQIMKAVGSPLATGRVLMRADKRYLVAPLYAGDLESLARGAGRGSLRLAALAIEAGASLGLQLAACHAAGYVHRDVKLANVLFNASGALVVADYGLAAARDPRTGGVPGGAGTLRYMAPESVVGAEVTAAADIWSLGILFVTLVTGQVPMRARTYAELTDEHTRLLAAIALLPRDANGLVDLAALGAAGIPLRRLAPLARLEAPIVTFVLDRMLAAAPSRRAEAAEVAGFFTAWSARWGTAAHARAAIDAHLAGPARDALGLERAGLLAYAHARTLPPG